MAYSQVAEGVGICEVLKIINVRVSPEVRESLKAKLVPDFLRDLMREEFLLNNPTHR